MHRQLGPALAAVVLLVPAAGCGSKTALVSAGVDADGGPGFDSGDPGTDSGRRDARPGDSGSDAGDDGGVVEGGRCSGTGPVVVVERANRWLTLPTAARRGERGVLVYTVEHPDGSRPRHLERVRITAHGEPTGERARVAMGYGGTIVPATLSGMPGYTLAFVTPSNVVSSALFDPGGELREVAAPIDTPTDQDRPALGITDETVILAYNRAGSTESEAIFTAIRTGRSTHRVIEARNASAAPSSAVEGFVDLAFVDGDEVDVGTYDGTAERFAARRIDLAGDPIRGVTIAEAPGGAVGIWGEVARAIPESVVRLEVAGAATSWRTEGEQVLEGAVAYDDSSDWALMVTGVASPEPGVVAYATDASRRARDVIAADVPTTSARGPRPAVLATGFPEQPFVVFWDEQEGRAGRILASLVTCR